MKVIITGTSQGIGKAIAELFLSNGHTVIGIDRQGASISHLCYTHYVCDVRDRENLPSIDGVQILINNAGKAHSSSIEETDEKLYDKIFSMKRKENFI